MAGRAGHRPGRRTLTLSTLYYQFDERYCLPRNEQEEEEKQRKKRRESNRISGQYNTICVSSSTTCKLYRSSDLDYDRRRRLPVLFSQQGTISFCDKMR